jgi:hypothetical protein
LTFAEAFKELKPLLGRARGLVVMDALKVLDPLELLEAAYSCEEGLSVIRVETSTAIMPALNSILGRTGDTLDT